MTREEARKAAEVMLAYADGKDLQICGQDSNEWADVVIPVFNWELNSYRIKPETKYRPFKNGDECREEMKKHEPFGWIQNKSSSDIMCISMVYTNCVCFGPNYQCTYYGAFYSYTFVDGEPFGIKEY